MRAKGDGGLLIEATPALYTDRGCAQILRFADDNTPQARRATSRARTNVFIYKTAAS